VVQIIQEVQEVQIIQVVQLVQIVVVATILPLTGTNKTEERTNKAILVNDKLNLTHDKSITLINTILTL